MSRPRARSVVLSGVALLVLAGCGPWARSVGSSSSDATAAVATDSAGNTYVAGWFRGTITIGSTTLVSDGGSADVFVASLTPDNAVRWARRGGGPSDDFPTAIATNGTQVAVTGRFAGTAYFGGSSLISNGSMDMFVARYTAADGGHLWSQRYGGALDDEASDVALDPAGNLFMTGYFKATINFGGGQLRVPFDSDLDVFIAKINANHTHAWSKNFTNDGNDRGYGIALDANGNIAIGGSFTNTINFGGGQLVSPQAMADGFVAAFDGAGTYLWSHDIGANDGNETVYGVAASRGEVFATGYVMKPVDLGGGLRGELGGTDGFVVKYGPGGAHRWDRRFGSTGNDYAYAVAVGRGAAATADVVYVAGAFEGSATFAPGLVKTANAGSDAFLAKYTSAGAGTWAKAYSSSGSDVFYAAAVDSATSAPVAGGYFTGSGTFEGASLATAGLADALIVRTNP